MEKPIIAACLAALLAGAVAWSGVAVLAGAHPFWAGTVPLLGLLGALPVYGMALRWPRGGALLGVALLMAGAAAAGLGKAAFAASFAENALAGQAWYLGWIILCAGATALIAMAILTAVRWRPAA